ncbi:predicted protein [Naegleria gruberi]|uniref:Protein N-terminal glutamine amidohydrolase n=1 Tax=Naegleria gruberi TaxID=5762 RepID=D2VSN4_NAEGR|nr:uncharacterized protein NAEGRDRAFT_72002 [Naegleria gruberi]EFC40220.1 predicted protein [Naegleria gruberi]|eukprot:XP_002672964.1 predicted protein [Naegleria gruberi strain NEG-M]
MFLSSDEKLLPMWYQNDTGGLIIWDYHVILVHKNSATQQSTVYDMDTRLDFPSTFESYIVNSFLLTFMIRNPSKRLCELMNCLKFRIVPACEFLKSFSSDRSHMINEEGEYSAKPPIYPPIRADPNTVMNLDDYRFMDRIDKGQILDLEQMCAFFGSNLDMLKDKFDTYFKE